MDRLTEGGKRRNLALYELFRRARVDINGWAGTRKEDNYGKLVDIVDITEVPLDGTSSM